VRGRVRMKSRNGCLRDRRCSEEEWAEVFFGWCGGRREDCWRSYIPLSFGLVLRSGSCHSSEREVLVPWEGMLLV
jgi:hypothetical protein